MIENVTKCDVCGVSLTDPAFDETRGGARTVVAAYVGLQEDVQRHPECHRVLKRFGKSDFAICYCCFLSALGVPELRETL